MGFSPTVYASGPRTFTFLFVITIYTIMMCLRMAENLIPFVKQRYVVVITLCVVLRTMYMVMWKQ